MSAGAKTRLDPGAAYEGVEAPQNFPSRLELEQYRALALRKTAPQVAYIRRKLLARDRKLRVLEFCCGNARLLIGLAEAGLLDYGLGIDAAGSRIGFAKEWVAERGLGQVELRHGDALATELAAQSFDLAVCITGAFQYFQPISASAPAKLLSRFHTALKPGGRILLELYPMPANIRQMLRLSPGGLRTWDPLPPEDRFAFYLHERHFDPKKSTLRHEKTFIGRDGSVDAGRVEVLAYYGQRQIATLLRQAGFGSVHVSHGFSPRDTVDAMVVTGTRKT